MQKKKYAIFTMDVEAFADTECVSNLGLPIEDDLLDGFDEYLKILDKHDIKSTLFTVGTLAPKISDQLKKHLANGHRIALHGYEHTPPMELTVSQFEEQTKKAKDTLTDLFDTEIMGYRAPCFSMDKERLDVLKNLGFKYDSSHLGFTMARHTVNLDLSDFSEKRENVFCNDGFFEFGISKQKIFGQPFPVSGGGYVRLINWEFMKSVIQQHIATHDYYVFYLHPFELTRRKIPLFKNLKSYDKYYLKAGIRSYGNHIEQIIKMLKSNGYEFVTFEELSKILAK